MLFPRSGYPYDLEELGAEARLHQKAEGPCSGATSIRGGTQGGI